MNCHQAERSFFGRRQCPILRSPFASNHQTDTMTSEEMNRAIDSSSSMRHNFQSEWKSLRHFKSGITVCLPNWQYRAKTSQRCWKFSRAASIGLKKKIEPPKNGIKNRKSGMKNRKGDTKNRKGSTKSPKGDTKNRKGETKSPKNGTKICK